jgi:hypothetical protein
LILIDCVELLGSGLLINMYCDLFSFQAVLWLPLDLIFFKNLSVIKVIF